MVTNPRLQLSVEEFEQFCAQPDNADRLFEYIGGEVIEAASNNLSSTLAMRIAIKLGAYVLDHDLGELSGADGGYRISGEDYIPDVAFISKQRQATPTLESYNRVSPDLVVEVLSPSNTQDEMRIKVANYLNAGTVVWVVHPDKQRIEVYTAGQPVKLIGLNDTLDAGTVVPGFVLNVADIFKGIG